MWPIMATYENRKLFLKYNSSRNEGGFTPTTFIILYI